MILKDDVVNRFVEKFCELVDHQKPELLDEVLADDVILAPPVRWERVQGKDKVLPLFIGLLGIFEDFHYRRRWFNGVELAMEFVARIGDQPMQGMDIITLNEAGQIKEIEVHIRPLDGIQAILNAVTEKMGAYPD